MHTLEQLTTGELQGAKRFSMAAGLTEFPRELFALEDSLEVLDLCGNALSDLPQDFGRFKRLKAVFFFNNHFEKIPSVLRDCPALDVFGFRYNKIAELNIDALPDHLRWLILTGNRLTSLPAGFSRFKKLQKCMLAGNQLTAVPEDMQACESLELLRLSANQLTALPRWLVEMPRLTWLAYAGNPFCDAIARDLPSLTAIDWATLDIAEQLGEGASGNIFKAKRLHDQGEAETVAVKVFKGEMTSDGSPMDERDATILAGTHQYLVPLLGAVASHPEKKRGLVLGLIPPAFKNMAGPPSLESCTRDTYAIGQRFKLDHVLAIVQAMVEVCEHLHGKGVMHGDFYPHNVLITDEADTLVTDFGAACFYDRADQTLARGLERLEVRALGCALDDMLQRLSDETPSKAPLLLELQKLCDEAMQTEPAARPSFSQIRERLAQLA